MDAEKGKRMISDALVIGMGTIQLSWATQSLGVTCQSVSSSLLDEMIEIPVLILDECCQVIS